MNPFKIGDTVMLLKPENTHPDFHGEHLIKDISGERLRSGGQWFHHSHFRLVKQGMVSRMSPKTGVQIAEEYFGSPSATQEEQDPQGLPQNAPGAKNDAGKPEAGLLQDFGLALMGVAEVASYGAKKYSRNGWQHVKDGERRYKNAGMRHRLAMGLEENCPESNLLHLKHAAWNILAELELHLRTKRSQSS